jgi:hypothetical protein
VGGEWRAGEGWAEGEGRVVEGEWRLVKGEWRLVKGEWRVVEGEWRVIEEWVKGIEGRVEDNAGRVKGEWPCEVKTYTQPQLRPQGDSVMGSPDCEQVQLAEEQLAWRAGVHEHVSPQPARLLADMLMAIPALHPAPSVTIPAQRGQAASPSLARPGGLGFRV